MNTMTSYFTGIKSERMHLSGSNEVDYISEQSKFDANGFLVFVLTG